MPWSSSVAGGSPGHSHARSSTDPRWNACAVGVGVMGREAYLPRDRGPRRACPAARAPWRLRAASAALALQGIGPRVRLELPHPAAAARRLLDPLRRAPGYAAAHRD